MKTVFFDIDTQIDFVFPAGALYAPGAATVVAQVARLNRYAASQGIPVVSTMDAHSENDPEFRNWPAHCVAGTVGQQKPAETLLDGCVTVPNTDAAVMIDAARQIILEKTTTNMFTNPNVSWLLEAIQAERYIVYGVVTEVCVAHAAFGLLKTGKRVELVTDAIRSLSADAERDTIERFRAAGGVLTTTEGTLHNWVS
jgi:nicotinamidase/pyrazinamidase